MLGCKHAIPVMLKTGGGSIIHSTSGFGAQGDQTLTAYAASKAALIALSRSVAAQYGKQGIRSNAIQIGLVTRVASSPEAHLAEVRELAGKIAAKPPVATAYVKQAAVAAGDLDLKSGLDLELDLFALLKPMNDVKEAALAFREKRAPQFTGD